MRNARAWMAAVLAIAALATGDPARSQGGAPPPAIPALIEQARALGAAGRHAEALAVLTAHEDTHIGDAEFDYALGRAALDAGLPASASIAFRRVLALQPGHMGAAIDLGRAYLALGNREQALASFQAIVALDPPPEIRERLLEMIALSTTGSARLALRGYLAAGLGHDSNVNAGFAGSRVFVPLFGAQVELAGSNQRRPDRYAMIAGAFDATLQMDPGLALVGGGEFLQRRNADESAFNLGGASGRFGLSAAGAGYVARAQLLAARSTMGGDTSRDTTALLLDAREAGVEAPWSAFAMGGRYRHPEGSLSVFDANFLLAGVGRNLPLDAQTQAFAGAWAGRENDRGGYAGGDRRLYGARIVLEHWLLPRLALLASAAWQKGRYDRTDTAFQTVRDDRRRILDLGLQYVPDEFWKLSVGVLGTKQDSSLPIHTYTSWDYGIRLRREFR
jgi:tetratricopeptide (TPR) repeat protein